MADLRPDVPDVGTWRDVLAHLAALRLCVVLCAANHRPRRCPLRAETRLGLERPEPGTPSPSHRGRRRRIEALDPLDSWSLADVVADCPLRGGCSGIRGRQS